MDSSNQTQNLEEVVIEKLVHGGQGIGELTDGRKVFVWNALPGEQVRIQILRKKRSFAEAIAKEILKASPERVEPQEANYLATSPWQILTYEAENRYKHDIVSELFTQAHVELPTFDISSSLIEWHYRNKMEYSFWGDDDGVHLALYSRGTHQKMIVTGSVLALPAIDEAAQAVIAMLNAHQVRAGDLKTIIIRASQDGRVAASLFVKTESFPELTLPNLMQGLRVYYSNPKSPASVPTKLLYEKGSAVLHDTLLGKQFTYDTDSFFQVNLPVFEQALERIRTSVDSERIIDMYAGVGSIGLSVGKHLVTLVELDPATAAMAKVNAKEAGNLTTEVVEVSTEKALDSITHESPVIFDPPRAGLHDKVITRVLEQLPPSVVYLSCNPATHARDLQKLTEQYTIRHFEAFNFFPRTPHIETLAVLTVS